MENTLKNLRLCVGTYGKRKENISFAWEPMETSKKLVFYVGTDGKYKGNTGFA